MNEWTQLVQRLGCGLGDWGSGVGFPTRTGISLFSAASRAALGSNHHPIQKISKAVFWGEKWGWGKFWLCERYLAGSSFFGCKAHLSIEKEVFGHYFINKCVRRNSVMHNSLIPRWIISAHFSGHHQTIQIIYKPWRCIWLVETLWNKKIHKYWRKAIYYNRNIVSNQYNERSRILVSKLCKRLYCYWHFVAIVASKYR